MGNKWDWILVRIGRDFHFLASKWHFIASTLNSLFLESDDFLQGPFTAKYNGQKMKYDWILLRIRPNFHFLASQNGTSLPLSTRNLLFLESDDFLQNPFYQNNLFHFF